MLFTQKYWWQASKKAERLTLNEYEKSNNSFNWNTDLSKW